MAAQAINLPAVAGPGRLADCNAVKLYMLAGKATLTIRSLKTGTRFTFKVSKPEDFREDRPAWFVSVLTGADNENSFSYIGMLSIYADASIGGPRVTFRQTAKSSFKKDAPSVKAWMWFVDQLIFDELHQSIEVWHEGRCGRCGRKLTVPESVASGIGPECATKMF